MAQLADRFERFVVRTLHALCSALVPLIGSIVVARDGAERSIAATRSSFEFAIAAAKRAGVAGEAAIVTCRELEKSY